MSSIFLCPVFKVYLNCSSLLSTVLGVGSAVQTTLVCFGSSGCFGLVFFGLLVIFCCFFGGWNLFSQTLLGYACSPRPFLWLRRSVWHHCSSPQGLPLESPGRRRLHLSHSAETAPWFQHSVSCGEQPGSSTRAVILCYTLFLPVTLATMKWLHVNIHGGTCPEKPIYTQAPSNVSLKWDKLN